MLMIGGSGRNVGKTTLICAILRKFASANSIIGLKVTGIRPGEEDSHGHHTHPLTENYSIVQESGENIRKDTAKMLQAGARKVYFIQSTDEQLPLAMKSFFELEDRNSIIICESRGLRHLLKPGVFILISNPAHTNLKSKNVEFVKYANLHLQFDSENHTMETNADKVNIENGMWQLIDKK